MDQITWYEDGEEGELSEDDHILQNVLVGLLRTMEPERRRQVEGVHVYPSKSCTYTLDKTRIFVRMRDDDGALLPACALRHILLHELAHIVNRETVGHDAGFWTWLRRLGAGVEQCPEKIPKRFNTCH